MVHKISAASVGTSTISVTARTRVNFAIIHLLTAKHFALCVNKLEATYIGKEYGEFFTEITSYVSSTIVMSVAGLEAYINELFADYQHHYPKEYHTLIEEIWETIEEQSILEKYRIALALKGEKLEAGGKLYQNTNILIKMRNALIHFKPEWEDEKKAHQKIDKDIAGRFKPSPFLLNKRLSFPQNCMSYSCAKWAVISSIEFVKDFEDRFGIKSKIDPFLKKSELPRD